MGMPVRRMCKAAGVVITLGYCSVLVYFSVFRFNAFNYLERRLGSDQVQEIVFEPLTTPNDSDSVQRKDITLDDIFISVKTTKRYEQQRLPIILKTWFQLAKNQASKKAKETDPKKQKAAGRKSQTVTEEKKQKTNKKKYCKQLKFEESTWFFSDTNNKYHRRFTNDHIVNTNCSDTHGDKDLCCKTSVEYDSFIESGKKWFCHFDDDNYVNVPRLVEVLRNYDFRQDWYLGRNSIPRPVNMMHNNTDKAPVVYSFWFATFGAGMCLSRSLALKMVPVAGGGKFMSICEKIRFPDDVTMGYVVEHLVKQRLTVLPEFHSHLEKMNLIPAETFRDQISFSYATGNVIEVPGFNINYDPSRFLSLHCFLFPHFEFCPR